MNAVLKKELFLLFKTPAAWLFSGFFLLTGGILFCIYQLNMGIGDFSYTLSVLKYYFIPAVPFLTMGIFADEKRQKTEPLLLTAPVSITKITAGKFIAVFEAFSLPVFVSLIFPLITGIISKTGNGANHLFGTDPGIIFASYTGFYLNGLCSVSAGLFFSSLTDNPPFAGIVTFLFLLFLTCAEPIGLLLPGSRFASLVFSGILLIIISVTAFRLTGSIPAGAVFATLGALIIGLTLVMNPPFFDHLIQRAAKSISFSSRFRNYSMGIISTGSLFFSILFIFTAFFSTVQIQLRKRWV